MIGIDIVENERFKNVEKNFFERVFTNNEIEYAKKFKCALDHFAGFFCAKEAVMKALEECDKISFLEIEICHMASGKPYVVLSGKAKEVFELNNYKKIEISISQTKNFATAVCQIN